MQWKIETIIEMGIWWHILNYELIVDVTPIPLPKKQR